MSEALDMNNAAEDIISSYETRIESVGAIFDTTRKILGNFQETFFDKKEEGQKINIQLRDTLAQNVHLRKKDFDSMTQDVLSAQEERETDVKNLLKGYLDQQREMARALRENLTRFKGALVKGDLQRVKEFQEMMKEVLVNQDDRKEEVSSKLKEFQKEQQKMTKKLKGLLVKGKDLRIKDLKKMLKEFRTQRKERLVQHTERGKEVQKILGRTKGKTIRKIHIVKNNKDNDDKRAKIFNGVKISMADVKKDKREK